jgi:hypothetical protein
MRFSPALSTIILISMAIAVVAPFDIAFTAATFGSSILRAVLIAILAMIGAFCARRTGLRLEGHGARRPIVIGVVMAVVVAAYVVAIDCYLFRFLLRDDYVQFLRLPLPGRLMYFMLRAFNENVIYRLFVFSSLFYLLFLARRSKDPTPALIFAAMVAAQLINIGMNVVALSSGPLSLLTLTYDSFRYVVPGVLWAWLFWRFGFVTAEVASVGCHIFLQPALGILL